MIHGTLANLLRITLQIYLKGKYKRIFTLFTLSSPGNSQSMVISLGVSCSGYLSTGLSLVILIGLGDSNLVVYKESWGGSCTKTSIMFRTSSHCFVLKITLPW